MQIDRIGRDKSYEMVTPYGLKVWDKVSVSGTISTGEDIQQAYKELNKVLEEAHNQTLIDINEMRGVQIREVEPSTTQDKIEKSMIEEMEDCSSYPEIQSFRFTVKNDAEKAVYERKLEELSPKNQ